MAKKAKRKKTASKLETKLIQELSRDIWPMERDVLFRPDRLKYVRKLLEPDGCVFCKARENEIGEESLLLKKSKYSMIVLNKFPYNPGHILVLPQRHCGEFLSLKDEEYMDLHQMLRKAFAGVTKAFEPKGINIGLNHGKVAGAGIPDHLHYHLVPRWKGDMNFFPLIAETKAIPTTLSDSFKKLLEALS